MNLPLIIKIGGFAWTIEEQSDVAREGNVFGSTHMTTQKIFIEPGLTSQKLKQTILHEIMHAAWFQSGLDRMFDRKELKKGEEEIIHTLSMAMFQVLKDNQLDFS